MWGFARIHRIVCFCSVLALLSNHVAAQDNPTFYLGFLSSVQDSAIPESLSMQWGSAFQVAMELMNSDKDGFRLKQVTEMCTCDAESAANAASQLAKKGVIGVVGPACSEAAMAAAKILQESGIPLISFAATSSQLSNRNMYPNFFRTAYSDEYQASAIATTINQLQMTNLTIVHTSDQYSLPLSRRIKELCGENIFKMQLLVNSTVNAEELEGMFNSIEPYSFLVLVLQPNVAKKFWELVVQLGKSNYPWWYLGSDGVTSVDAHIKGNALEGEVGISPYSGDSSDDIFCQRFYQHWSENAYAGLTNRTSSYIPYVIDSVISFFEVVDNLLKSGIKVDASNVARALGSQPGYKGCTGNVRFDPRTGSRQLTSGALYDFVSYMDDSWQLKGRIADGNFTSLQPLQRPGTFPADGEIYIGPANGGHHGKVNKALVAAIVVFSSAFVLVSVAFVLYYRFRQNSPMAFFRMPVRS